MPNAFFQHPQKHTVTVQINNAQLLHIKAALAAYSPSHQETVFDALHAYYVSPSDTLAMLQEIDITQADPQKIYTLCF